MGVKASGSTSSPSTVKVAPPPPPPPPKIEVNAQTHELELKPPPPLPREEPHKKSSFDANAATIRSLQEKFACGRGTSDDSIGRGTSDDSIGGGSEAALAHRDDDDEAPSVKRSNGLRRGSSDDSLGDPTTNLRALVNNPAISPEGRGAVTALLASSTDTRVAASRLVNSSQFRNQSPDVQGRVLQLAAKTGEAGTKALAKLSQRDDDVFGSTDVKGNTLLSNLESMAASPNKDVRRALVSTMADIANPKRIWQGTSPTCTVTTMQFEVAKANPAEYTRLMAGLALDLQVTMAGGGVLKLTQTDLSPQALKAQRRTITEAAFQDAAMDYANGSEVYDTKREESVRADGSTHKGLKGEMIRDLAVQLSNAKYERYDIPDDKTAAGVADVLAGKSTITVNSPVLVDIDMGSFNHCVAFDGIDQDNVFLRDPETGNRESMSLAEFNKRAVAAYAVVT